MGFVRPANRQTGRIAADSEVLIWWRTRAGIKGQPYCGLVEPIQGLEAVSVARSVAFVNKGRVLVHTKNVNYFPIILERYQKIAAVYAVDTVDVKGHNSA